MSKEPGKRAQTTNAQDIVGRDLAKPGKDTLTTQLTQHCDTADPNVHGDGCYLPPTQRATLANLTRGRMIVAGTKFDLAIEQAYTDKMIEKAPDPPILASFIADTIGTATGGFFKKSIERLVSSGLVGLEQESMEAGITALMEDSARKASSKNLDTIIKGVVDRGKKYAIDLVKTPSDKKEYASLLKQLQRDAARRFQDLRESTVAASNDAELFALFLSFDVDNHHVDMYKEELLKKIERYTSSGTADIGVKAKDRTNRPAVHMTKVAWLVYASGRERQLVFETYDAGQAPRMPNANPFVPHHQPRLADSPDLEEVDWKWSQYVPDEFKTEALMRHHLQWGVEPREIKLDDTPPKAPKLVPRIDLTPRQNASRDWDETRGRTGEPAPDYTKAFDNVDMSKVK